MGGPIWPPVTGQHQLHRWPALHDPPRRPPLTSRSNRQGPAPDPPHLRARREMLQRLAAGVRVLLPERACALLARMAARGLTPDEVATARDALVLVRAFAEDHSSRVRISAWT